MKLFLHSMKYGNIAHYDWEMTLLEEREGFLIAEGKAGRALKHHTKGQTFKIPHASLEVYALQKGFTVSFDISDGKVISIYCNVSEPCIRDGADVSFIDLDLDLLWNEDLGWHVMDEEEFEENRVKLNYPNDLTAYARQALNDLRERIRQNDFPFDGSLDERIAGITGKTSKQKHS